MNFTQRLQWHQDSRWQSANNTGRHPKPLESIIQEAIWGTKGLYRPYQVWGNHLHSHKITFTFPGREGNCSKQAQTGKGTWYNVTDELINEVATVHLVSFIKPVSEQMGNRGLAKYQCKSIYIAFPNQPHMKERATEHHPHVEKLGCCMLSTAYKDRQPGRQRRTSWEGSEREEENISVFIWWDNPIGFSTWISLITKLFRALSANWKNFYNDL